MKGLILYLLELIMISGILYTYYHFFLKNKKFHHYNRFYLLLTVLFSLTVPILHIPVFFSDQVTNSSFVVETLTSISPGNTQPLHEIQATSPTVSKTLDWLLIFKYAYLAILVAGLTRVLLGISRLIKLRQKNNSEKLGKILFIYTTERGTPFSFFRWLFWNNEIDINSQQGKQIFRHELFHIQQKHSIDILFMELLSCIGWINPVFFIVKKELKVIHEFLADEYAVSGRDNTAYAELLLMQSLYTKHSLAHSFYHSQVKRRITMLMRSEKIAYQYVRKLLVLPLGILLFGLFAFSYYKIENGSTLVSNEINVLKNFHSKNPEIENKIKLLQAQVSIQRIDTSGNPLIVLNGIIMNRSLEEINKIIQPNSIETMNVLKGEAGLKKYGKKGINGVIEINTKHADSGQAPADSKPTRIYDENETEIPASFPGGQEEFREYILKNQDKIHSSYTRGDTGMRVKNGFLEVKVKFIVHTDGSLSDISASTSEQFGMDAIWFISHGPKWIPAVLNGEAVNSWVTQVVQVPFIKYANPVIENDKKKSTIPTPTISVKDLKKATVFQLTGLTEKTKIASYTFTIDRPEGEIVAIKNSGNEFNVYTRNQINEATAGRMLTLDNIIVMENGKEKRVPSRLWYITE